MLDFRHSLALSVGIFGMASTPAMALEVGEQAPCVVLEQQLPGGAMAEGCIREHEATQTHTIIEFFSITCSACEANLPNISALGKELIPFATTRFVSIDRDRAAAIDYVNKTPLIMDFPVALDADRDAKKAYGVVATPTIFVLNSQNDVVYKHIGVLSVDDRMAIKTLVKEGN